jgi:Ulp1 family protease
MTNQDTSDFFQKLLFRYIIDEYVSQYGGEEMPGQNEWDKFPEVDAPQQKNGIDCGIFTVLVGVFLAQGYSKAMDEFAAAINH